MLSHVSYVVSGTLQSGPLPVLSRVITPLTYTGRPLYLHLPFYKAHFIEVITPCITRGGPSCCCGFCWHHLWQIHPDLLGKSSIIQLFVIFIASSTSTTEDEASNHKQWIGKDGFSQDTPKKSLAQMLHGAGVFTYICFQNYSNVGKLTIRWACGLCFTLNKTLQYDLGIWRYDLTYLVALWQSNMDIRPNGYHYQTNQNNISAGTSFSYRKHMFYLPAK